MEDHNNLEVTKVFNCDCRSHGFGLNEWIEDYDPRYHTGLEVQTENINLEGESEYDWVEINLELWYLGAGKDYYDLLKQRIRAAWRILRGRRATFDYYTFKPKQIRELGEHLIAEADRLKELGFSDDGVREKK